MPGRSPSALPAMSATSSGMAGCTGVFRRGGRATPAAGLRPTARLRGARRDAVDVAAEVTDEHVALRVLPERRGHHAELPQRKGLVGPVEVQRPELAGVEVAE